LNFSQSSQDRKLRVRWEGCLSKSAQLVSGRPHLIDCVENNWIVGVLNNIPCMQFPDFYLSNLLTKVTLSPFSPLPGITGLLMS
jgi:hypothetical protein